MAWGIIIAAYLFLAGLSAGAYLTSSYVAHKYPSNKTVRIVGRYISPILIGIGLLLLVVDAEAGIKNPLRFIYLYTNFTSVMTIGTYIITFFMIISLFIAVMEFFKKEVNKIIEYTGIFFAVATAIYTGFLIGVVQSVPLWNTSILPILFVVSAISTGIAGTLLIAGFVNKQDVANIIGVKKVHFTLLIVEIFFIFTMFLITYNTNEAAALSISSMLSGEYALLFWLGLVTIGLFLPLIIEGYELYQHNKNKSEHKNHSIIMTVVTESSVLIGGFTLRFLILAAAVPISFL